jgi:hypothetical protein
MTLFCKIQRPTHSTWCYPGRSRLEKKAFAVLKANLDEEKATRIMAQVEADVLSWAVLDLKISADRFAT